MHRHCIESRVLADLDQMEAEPPGQLKSPEKLPELRCRGTNKDGNS